MALFVALGGTAIAARHYLISSTSQIKPSVLRSLRGKTGAAGKPGPTGPQGPAGAQGPPGAALKLTEVVGEEAPLDKEHHEDSSYAACPVGESAVSGGALSTPRVDEVTGSYMAQGARGWVAEASVLNLESPGVGAIQAIVYCESTG